MKKRFTEEQIIGFLRDEEAGLPIKELCRQHGFSKTSQLASQADQAAWDRAGRPKTCKLVENRALAYILKLEARNMQFCMNPFPTSKKKPALQEGWLVSLRQSILLVKPREQ